MDIGRAPNRSRRAPDFSILVGAGGATLNGGNTVEGGECSRFGARQPTCLEHHDHFAG